MAATDGGVRLRGDHFGGREVDNALVRGVGHREAIPRVCVLCER